MNHNALNHLNFLRAVIDCELGKGNEPMLSKVSAAIVQIKKGTVPPYDEQAFTIWDWITFAENFLVNSGVSPLKYRFPSGERVNNYVKPLDEVAKKITTFQTSTTVVNVLDPADVPKGALEKAADAIREGMAIATGVRAKHSHYHKSVEGFDYIDVYRVLQLFNVTDPCIQHAVKKLLVAGGRGAGKDISRDIKEAIDSLHRWQEMRSEENRNG